MSIKARIDGLNISFHISNEGVYTLDVELKYVVLKLRKSVFDESYLDIEMS